MTEQLPEQQAGPCAVSAEASAAGVQGKQQQHANAAAPPPANPGHLDDDSPLQTMEDAPEITPEWCRRLARELNKATWRGAEACHRVLPAPLLLRVLRRAADLLKSEPTLVELDPAAIGGLPVIVVGDTHGQYHDVLRL